MPLSRPVTPNVRVAMVDVSAGAILVGEDYFRKPAKVTNGISAGLMVRPDTPDGPSRLVFRGGYIQEAFSTAGAVFKIKDCAGVEWFAGGQALFEGDSTKEIRVGIMPELSGFFKQGDNGWEVRLGLGYLQDDRLVLIVRLGAITDRTNGCRRSSGDEMLERWKVR